MPGEEENTSAYFAVRDLAGPAQSPAVDATDADRLAELAFSKRYPAVIPGRTGRILGVAVQLVVCQNETPSGSDASKGAPPLEP